MEHSNIKRYYIGDLKIESQVIIELISKTSKDEYVAKLFCDEKEIKDICKKEKFRFFNKNPKLHMVHKRLKEIINYWTLETINNSPTNGVDVVIYKRINNEEYEVINKNFDSLEYIDIKDISINKLAYSIKNVLIEESSLSSGPSYCITGDTHGDLDFKVFYRAKKSRYTDIFVCGDFGYIWNGSLKEQKRLDYLSNIGLNIYFVCGNHENFDLLEKYPIVNINGGKAHKIRENIYHLMRGEIFIFGDKKILAFGGANSTDKDLRKEGKTWWLQEVPTDTEKDNARNNLIKHNNKVDYIITHTGHTSALKDMNGDYRIDEVSDFLSEIYDTTEFNHWYFGHMHKNHTYIEGKSTCINELILKLNL